MRNASLIVIFSFFVNVACFPQSRLSLAQCDSLFVRNNFELLAEQFHVDAAQAAVIQAGIWEQPYFSIELNALNPGRGRVFDLGANGQKAFAVQQLIYLAGKKQREVEVARSDKNLAELQFRDLMRKLKFELRQNYYELFFDQKKASSILTRLANLDTLISAYSTEAQKGVIPLKDVVRLQSLALSFKSELVGIQSDIHALQQRLQLLTGVQQIIEPVINELQIDSRIAQVLNWTDSLLQSKIIQHNPEYLMAVELSENTRLQLQWQKALNAPDLTVGLAYDQSGGAFSNQFNLTCGIPLPLWKRNAGNVKMYEAMLKENQLMADQKKAELYSKLHATLQSLLFLQKQYAEAAPTFQNFETVYEGVLQNFHKRNISLIEFTDFMESYDESNLFFNEIKKEIMMNGESLNLLVNETIF